MKPVMDSMALSMTWPSSYSKTWDMTTAFPLEQPGRSGVMCPQVPAMSRSYLIGSISLPIESKSGSVPASTVTRKRSSALTSSLDGNPGMRSASRSRCGILGSSRSQRPTKAQCWLSSFPAFCSFTTSNVCTGQDPSKRMMPSKQCSATSGFAPSTAAWRVEAWLMSSLLNTPLSSNQWAVSSGSFERPSATMTTTASSQDRSSRGSSQSCWMPCAMPLRERSRRLGDSAYIVTTKTSLTYPRFLEL
mmetsp:Transcript_30038/g.84613  ORF Transcript_30038/g.84613 Transcript_30038/m.84613 type:complete len:247 (-) Transcript_30038:830-1570(-)